MITEKQRKRIIFAVCLLFVLVHYGLGFRLSYQPDIYGRVNISHSYYDALFMSDVSGRLLSSAVWWVLRWLPFKVYFYVALVSSILILAFTAYRYGVLLAAQIEKTGSFKLNTVHLLLCSLLSFITIANIFSAEYFLYIDMTVNTVMGILMCVEAAAAFIKYLESGNKKELVKAGLLILFVPFIYEIIAGIFLIITIPFILKYSSTFISFIKNQIIAGLLYSSGTLIKTLYTVLVIHSSRAGFDQKTLSAAATAYAPAGTSPEVYIFQRITFGMWGYALACMVIAGLIIAAIIRNRSYFELLKGTYLVFASVVIALVPYIFRLTDEYKPRIYYPLGCLLGALITYGLLCVPGAFETIPYRYVLTGTIAVFICVQWFSFAQMYVDQYVTNYEEKVLSEIIGEAISEYEEDSGSTIRKAVFYSDAVRTKYVNVNGWCITQRSYDASWSKMSVLNYYLDKNYTRGDVDSELADYFISKDWDTFSSEQIVFKGDTVHICTY